MTPVWLLRSAYSSCNSAARTARAADRRLEQGDRRGRYCGLEHRDAPEHVQPPAPRIVAAGTGCPRDARRRAAAGQHRVRTVAGAAAARRRVGYLGGGAPDPAGLADQPLSPRAARWVPRNGSHLAVLGYEDARAQDDPRAGVLEFYEGAYLAGARLAGWEIGRLASPGGITDPTLRCTRAYLGIAKPAIPLPACSGPLGTRQRCRAPVWRA
jgi:hypothetical protein